MSESATRERTRQRVANGNSFGTCAMLLCWFNFKKFANIWWNKTRWNKRNKVWTSANSLFKWRFRSRRRRRLIGTLRNCDGDGKENVKKAVGLMSKTTTLHVHHAFFYISLLSLLNYDAKWPNFKFTWERERQDDKFYHLCLNSGAVPSFHLQPKFPSANWDNRAKKFERMRSLFFCDVFMDVAVVRSEGH